MGGWGGGGSSFPSQQRGEDVQGFSLLKENDGVDFLLLPSLLKILMVPEITVQAQQPPSAMVTAYNQPAQGRRALRGQPGLSSPAHSPATTGCLFLAVPP